jgi:thiol:disulfide interchange protein DsbD
MLRPLFTFLLLFVALGLSAQFENPISWDFRYEPVSGDEYKLIAVSTAEDGFMIYSQFTPEGGPLPTVFTWTPGDHYELIGKTQEKGHLKSGMDEMFGVKVDKFLGDQPVTWTQRVKIKDFTQPIELMVEWMCCDDEQCLPPTDEVHAFKITPAGPERVKITTPTSTTPKTSPVAASNTPAVRTRSSTKPAPSVPITAPAAAPKTPAPPTETPSIPAVDPTTTDRPVMATYTALGVAASANDPVSWVFTAEKMADDEYRVNMTGTLSPSWTIYSMDVDPEIGPIPTAFIIESGETIGAVSEMSATLKTKFDKAWNAEVAKIDGGTVTYSQVVRARAGDKVAGFVEYQSCDDEMCFPPKEVPFALDLTGPEPVVSIDGLIGGQSVTAVPPGSNATVLPQDQLGIAVSFDPEPVGNCSEGAATTKNKGLWTIFGLGLLGGLFAMLMPCIFPMIPLTVSFFTKSGGSRGEGIRKAGLYGFFIFMIYVLLSVPFHLLDGLDPGILNSIASSVSLNIVFFVVFMFFAGSFFGFYELTLPESWSNRASQAEGTGGIAGIFFMALTLALVSFSCTGPILGSLLVEAVSGGAWPLTAGMAGFGVALGLPFALFAAFPGFLNSMPKSGGWLNSVKVVLGFVEVALAFKFLSNADLVGEWNLLRIEPFLLVWMLCSIGIAAYLFGLIRFPLDSKKRKTGPIAMVIAVAGVIFTGYLAFGLTADADTGTYSNRNLLSGIAPPVCYNYFLPCDEERNITPFKNLEEGLAYARKVNKPVMLDFTGYTCVNCRKMEENVWTVDKVDRFLQEDYVIVSLYVDDRTELPVEERREITRQDGSGRKKLIDQVGEKWHYFQQTVYAKSSQPYYVLVHPDGRTLNPPVAYTPDADDYADFLACGLQTYRKMEQGK